MARIEVLADSVINRIAAGEVVERPASVVKELVENSLDSGATRVVIELAVGGRSLVRVGDDGCGMDHDNSLLALERHATSKIRSAEDLYQLSTLGFRGEALPSIAAVSRFALTSCADPGEGGVRIDVDGGRILGVEPVARARGTMVEVRDLFFNLPARRKFLHSPETELRHAQDAVWGAALVRPEVAFVLRHGPRTLLDVAVVADEAARFRDLLKRRDTGPVHRFEAAGGGVEVWGLIATGGGKGRPVFHLVVNGRPVRDRLLVGAVLRALREAGGGFGGARVAVFIRLPADAVDVNVHPAKAEVRFARGGSVFGVVERAVRSAVAAAQGRVEVRRFTPLEAGAARAAEPAAPAYGQPGTAPLFPHPAYDAGAEVPSLSAAQPHGRPASGPRESSADTPFGRLIGQYRSSFLLLEDEVGLVIVDQHVAHERVLYDQIRRRLAGEPGPSQGLLTPVLVEVGEPLTAALPRVADLLDDVGIVAEPFGRDTIRITALPPEVDAEAARLLVVDLLERATSLDGVPERVAEALAEELAAMLSCRAAIKINHPLAAEEQRALLRDLRTTDNPYRCPHGRPILLRLSQEEMERRLGRR